jgi:hypothetical protein
MPLPPAQASRGNVVTAPRLASRVMRARRESLCPVCYCPIRVGQQIAKRGYWQHIEHVVQATQDRSDERKRS